MLESNAIQDRFARCAKNTAGQPTPSISHAPAVLPSFVMRKYLLPLQCTSILEICAAAEPLSHSELFLPLLQHKIVEEHVKCVIQAAGAGLFTTVLPDPVVATLVDNVSTFCGLYGCQMISVLVQVRHVDCVIDARKNMKEIHTCVCLCVFIILRCRLRRSKFLRCCKIHSRD